MMENVLVRKIEGVPDEEKVDFVLIDLYSKLIKRKDNYNNEKSIKIANDIYSQLLDNNYDKKEC